MTNVVNTGDNYSLFATTFKSGVPSITNCYAISDAPIACDMASEKVVYLASNQYVLNEETEEVLDDYKFINVNSTIASKITSSASTITTIDGVKVYANYEAMATAGNTYTTFNNDCWDTTAGYPVWKNL